jgi:tRNA A-37 threonylcarbamoyl transferase component Bud32/tetratricopeptide (TPR) repeat protein
MTAQDSNFDQNLAELTLDRAFADLDRNAPAEAVVAQLRVIEAACSGMSRARLLHARGLAMNRLGFPSEALGDLHEAARLFDDHEQRGDVARVWRSIARVHSWRGEGREAAFALLRVVAEEGKQIRNIALALLDAGRLELEIGRPHDADVLLRRGLEIGAEIVSAGERRAGQLNRSQALMATGDIAGAKAVLSEIDLSAASGRMRHLVAMQQARVAIREHDLSSARAFIGEANDLAPSQSDSFGRIEQKQVQAELAFADGNPAAALDLMRAVIARYAADDLAGREVVARLFEARALDILDRDEEADRTLAAALRRAVSRGLAGYADEIRAQLALRGRPQNAQPPVLEQAEPDLGSTGRFVRRRPLGVGGFGSVSRAYDLELGKEVVLKRLELASIYDPELRASRLEAARMEIAAASRIRHPGVGQVFGLLTEPDGETLLVRELVEGPTLREAMAGSLHAAEKLGIMTHIAHCLAAIHAASVVHRDLKPENVVLRNGLMPVIIDFGVSAIGQPSAAGEGANTQAYAAPEQLAGRAVDAGADLYAFGSICYELFLGSLPDRPIAGIRGFLASKERAHRIREAMREAGAPDGVAEIVARLLASSRRDRPRKARDVALTLQALTD